MNTDTQASPTLLTLAQEALSHFETRERANGDKFICTKDTRPQWVQDLCRRAHGDMMPDDTKYEYIEAALSLIVEHDGDTEAAFDSIEADIYTADLTGWLASHVHRYTYCDEAIEEYGRDFFVDTLGLISVGQCFERREVFESVVISLDDELSNR